MQCTVLNIHYSLDVHFWLDNLGGTGVLYSHERHWVDSTRSFACHVRHHTPVGVVESMKSYKSLQVSV